MDYKKLYLNEKLAHSKTLKDAGNYLARVGELQQQLADLISEKIQAELAQEQDNKEV